MLTMTLDAEIEEHLESLGAKDDSSKTALARKALLEALEDLEDVRIAEERLAGDEKRWSLDELVYR